MQPIEASDFHDIAKPADPRLSPDGGRVAFVRKQPEDDESYAATIHIVDVESGDRRRFTVEEGVDAEPRWSPSGDRLAFTSTRGADDDRQQLWVLPVDGGGEARQVTDLVGGVSGIAWAPDGERIAFVQSVTAEDREEERDRSVPEDYEPEDPDPRVIDRTVYRSGEQYFDGARSHVYTVAVDEDSAVADPDADEPAAADVTRWTDGDADFGAPAWGDADTLYYTEEVGDDPDDSYEIAICAHDLAADDAERVHTTYGWGSSLAATADGKVAFTHTEPDQPSIQQTDLHVLHREDDTVAEITADLDRTLGHEAAPQWGPAEETVFFTTPDEGQTALWHAPGDGSDDPARVLRRGAVSGGDVAGEDGAGPEEVSVALALSEWDHPGDVFHFDGDEFTRLTELNADYLAERAVGEPEELHFESEQGEVHGWVLTPPAFDGDGNGAGDSDGDGDGDDQFPLAVEIHGGPHAMWTTAGTMWHEFQTLAARGYVVFWSNPRGSTGYGEEYMQAIERDWGEVTLTDVMAGVELVADRDYVDEGNTFVTGGSFGGYMTAWTVGQTDYFDGAVSQRGVYDLTGFYGSTDGAYKLVEGDFDTTPWEEPEWLWEQSPTAHAEHVDTPTLLIHSDDDYRTPACTAELYHRILRKHDVDTRFVRYPREGHELSRSGEPGHIVDRMERIARWFDGYSEHHDAPVALERPENEGLSAGDEDGDEDGDDGDEDGDDADEE
ncbi:prolyl oligopeptidase family serine peptidase [Haloparvum sp. PAK95]|uniref:prolyl oligopeptidase family serine peptidase n=1 Tax=Haloparvum sp. PAK95 TaxID=3418962 RepID=UPI003D2EC965